MVFASRGPGSANESLLKCYLSKEGAHLDFLWVFWESGYAPASALIQTGRDWKKAGEDLNAAASEVCVIMFLTHQENLVMECFSTPKPSSMLPPQEVHSALALQETIAFGGTASLSNLQPCLSPGVPSCCRQNGRISDTDSNPGNTHACHLVRCARCFGGSNFTAWSHGYTQVRRLFLGLFECDDSRD